MMPNPAPESCTTQHPLPSPAIRRCHPADIVGYRQPLQSEVEHIFKAGSYQDKLSAVCACVLVWGVFLTALCWAKGYMGVHSLHKLPSDVPDSHCRCHMLHQVPHIAILHCFTTGV